jgi:hypothetical protein
MSVINGMTVAVAIVCVSAFAPLAEAKRVSGEFSGSGTLTQLDLDGDGTASASSNVSVGSGTLGLTHGWGASELAPWDGTSFCSDTELKQVFTASATAVRVESGDVYYMQFGDGWLCYNYQDSTFMFTGHDTVSGGTGVFAGATGRITTTGKGKVLLRDANGGAAMSAFSGTTKGEIVLRVR